LPTLHVKAGEKGLLEFNIAFKEYINKINEIYKKGSYTKYNSKIYFDKNLLKSEIQMLIEDVIFGLNLNLHF